jgi:hypothetical protein
MTNEALEKLKYPIGKFEAPDIIDSQILKSWISDIEAFPQHLETLIIPLITANLNLSYRPNGWTVKQVVHHCADSHMNALIRFKLALTEDAPIIKPYHEDKWANLVDGLTDSTVDSLYILKGLHSKFGLLLKNLSEEDLGRVYIHPAHGKRFRLDEAVGMYAWHGNHHLAHIRQALMS